MPSYEDKKIQLLNDEVLRLRREGCYEQALSAAHRACQLAEQNYGPTHPQYGLCVNNLGSLYLALGNFAAAEPLVQRALRICRISPGSDHPEYALLLNNLGSLYHGMGNF